MRNREEQHAHLRDTSIPKDHPLRPRFEDNIEWRLRCPAEVREAAIGDDLANTLFTRLRAKPQTDFLRKRSGYTEDSGS